MKASNATITVTLDDRMSAALDGYKRTIERLIAARDGQHSSLMACVGGVALAASASTAKFSRRRLLGLR